MTLSRAELRIEGRVQGVFFRQSALEEARRLKLVGFVRNCDGGEVEAVCEGEAEDCEAFVRWCHQGPSGARVERVHRVEAPPTGGFVDFRVAR